MLYGVAIAAVWLALELRSVRTRKIRSPHLVVAGLVLGLAVALAYLPVLIVSGPDKLASNRFVVPLGIGDLANELPRSLANTFGFWNRDIPLLLAGLLAIGFVIGSWRVRLGLVAAGTCVVLVLIQRVAPFERVWLFLLPLYVAIASGGLARLVDGRWLAIGFGALLGFFTLTSGSIWSSTETGAFPDAEAVTRMLAGRLADGDTLMTTLPASLPELQYYFPRYGLSIDALVRSPEAAAHLYVVSPTDETPQIHGWGEPHRIERYSAADLFELAR
jgi:hypothetical protein